MTPPLSIPREIEIFSFYPSFESIHGMLVEIYVYVFNDQGALLDCQALQRGKALVAVTEEELRGAHIVVGPPLDELVCQPITLESIRACHVFEAEWTFESGKRSYFLSAVPETVWRWWLVHSLWSKLRRKPVDVEDILIW